MWISIYHMNTIAYNIPYITITYMISYDYKCVKLQWYKHISYECNRLKYILQFPIKMYYGPIICTTSQVMYFYLAIPYYHNWINNLSCDRNDLWHVIWVQLDISISISLQLQPIHHVNTIKSSISSDYNCLNRSYV